MTGSQKHGDNHTSSCPAPGIFPSVTEFQQGMGTPGTVALYSSSMIVLLTNSILLSILIRTFLKKAPRSQVPYLCWVSSLYTAISFFTVLMIYLPRSTEFLLSSYRVFEALVISRFTTKYICLHSREICRFVELNLMWYGGEKSLMNKLGDNSRMR